MSFYKGELLFPIDETNPAFANTLGAADFDGNGLLDVIIGYTIINSTIRNEVKMLFNEEADEFELLGDELILGGAPRLLNPRELIIDDFNSDGDPGVFIAAHGRRRSGAGRAERSAAFQWTRPPG